jgi:hypothetical protein
MSRRAATVALMETQRPPNWLYLDDSDHKEIGIRRGDYDRLCYALQLCTVPFLGTPRPTHLL